MQLTVYFHGKTKNRELDSLISEYTRRLGFYAKLQVVVLPELKNSKGKSVEWIKEQEDQLLLKNLDRKDTLILLDENGTSMGSRQFASFLEKKAMQIHGRLCFAIGGPFGFGREAHERSESSLSLSKMTFPHDMVRLFFMEQLYRSFTIQRNESYHHD